MHPHDLTFPGVLVLLFLLACYFLPWMIAVTRNVEHRSAIALINLLLGWTVLGWLAALIWAVVEKTDRGITGQGERENLRDLSAEERTELLARQRATGRR